MQKKPKSQARFFLEGLNFNKDSNLIILSQDISHKISNVLRLQPGNTIELINKDTGESFLAEISHQKDTAKILHKIKEASLQHQDTNAKPSSLNSHLTTNNNISTSHSHIHCKVRALIAFCKLDTTELICQKLTELGVSEIIFFEADRSVVKLKTSDYQKKLDRLNKISQAAAQQSMQYAIPTIKIHKNFLELAKQENLTSSVNLFAYQFAKETITTTLSNILKLKSDLEINFIIGPEGGFADREIEIFNSSNFHQIKISNNVLRAETATILCAGTILLMINDK